MGIAIENCSCIAEDVMKIFEVSKKINTKVILQCNFL